MQVDTPVYFWRGNGASRRHYAMWRAPDGSWIALRDRWVVSNSPRQFKRSIKTFGPFPDREAAMEAIRHG
jgi:hypothetical protein